MISIFSFCLLPFVLGSVWASTIADVLDLPEPLGSKALAKAKTAALKADVRCLRQTMFDQICDEVQERCQEFFAGRGAQCLLLEALRRLVRVESAVAGDGASLRRHWELAWLIEQVAKARFEAGRIPIHDMAQARAERLLAELRLIEARSGPEVVSSSSARFAGLGAAEIQFGKQLSQAVAQLGKTRPAELRHDRLAGTSAECAARFKQFLAGQGDNDTLLEALRHRFEAGKGLAATNTQHFLAIERLWEAAYQVEAVNRQHHEAGRIPTKVWLESRALRTEAELMLLELRAEAGPGLTFSAAQSGIPVEFNPLKAKALAQAKFAVSHANRSDLLHAWHADLEMAYESRARSFLAGAGTLNVLLALTQRCREAELALASSEAGRRLAFERCWTRTWQFEQVNQTRFRAGRIPRHHLAQTVAARLEAEIAWLIALR